MDFQTIIETIKVYAFNFRDWFVALPQQNQIIYGLILFLLAAAAITIAYYAIKLTVLTVYYAIYGVAWLAGNTVYGIFWLTGQILKGVFVGLTIMFYVLAAVFIKLPIKLLSDRNYSVDMFAQELEANIEYFTKQAYPEEKKPEIVVTPVAPLAPQPVPTTIQVVIQQNAEKQITVKAPIEHPIAPQAFHCNNCGAKFTVKMTTLLASRGKCFCEECGNQFKQENNLPVPVNA